MTCAFVLDLLKWKFLSGGKHVRQKEIRLRRFIDTAAVTASTSSPDSNGTVFSIWNVNINVIGNETQIVFSATNVQNGVPGDFKYYVSYVVTGKIR